MIVPAQPRFRIREKVHGAVIEQIMPGPIQRLQRAIGVFRQPPEHLDKVQCGVRLRRIPIGSDQLTGNIIRIIPMDQSSDNYIPVANTLLLGGRITKQVHKILVLRIGVRG